LHPRSFPFSSRGTTLHLTAKALCNRCAVTAQSVRNRCEIAVQSLRNWRNRLKIIAANRGANALKSLRKRFVIAGESLCNCCKIALQSLQYRCGNRCGIAAESRSYWGVERHGRFLEKCKSEWSRIATFADSNNTVRLFVPGVSLL
jgi:hypothetical protein